jgi:hypothetical protein
MFDNHKSSSHFYQEDGNILDSDDVVENATDVLETYPLRDMS